MRLTPGLLHSGLQRLQRLINRGDKAAAAGAPGTARIAAPAHDDNALYAQACDHQRNGQLDQAESLLRNLLQKYPKDFDVLHRLGMVQGQRENYQSAADLIEQALAVEPDNAAANCSLGNCLRGLGMHQAALTRYDRALALRPDDADAWNNRGATLRDLKALTQALDSFDRALAINPNHVVALDNRGTVLGDLKRPFDALACHDRALSINAGYVLGHCNRGTLLRLLGRYDEALASFTRGLALDPNHLPSLLNRGMLLIHLARTEDAAADLSRLISLAPDYDFALGHLLHARMRCCDWNDLATLLTAIAKGVQDGKKVAEPYSYVGVATSPGLFYRCTEIHARERFPAVAGAHAHVPRRTHHKIRLGYVSGEFRQHATSILIAELMEKHDASRFEWYAFDNGWDDNSSMRRRLTGAFKEMVDISQQVDGDAARAVYEREIDILIDLNGHVGRARPGVFGLRPAPVQVNWLGFPGSTAADFMDYIIADAHTIPSADEAWYAERIVRLPDTYQVNDARRTVSESLPSRSAVQLPERAFVFCCFNNCYKITPEVFDVWMRLLRAVDHSVLWLLEDSAAASRNLRSEATARGVDASRLVFAPHMPLADHLSRQRLADLFLDTLPCNAHTTASDALWAGLPLLTCTGTTFAGRVAGSLLHAIGLPELVAQDLVQYEALALQLATQPSVLSGLRARLQRNKYTHPLFNTERFRQHIENAYVLMHERRLRGEAPVSFSVAPIP